LIFDFFLIQGFPFLQNEKIRKKKTACHFVKRRKEIEVSGNNLLAFVSFL